MWKTGREKVRNGKEEDEREGNWRIRREKREGLWRIKGEEGKGNSGE